MTFGEKRSICRDARSFPILLQNSSLFCRLSSQISIFDLSSILIIRTANNNLFDSACCAPGWRSFVCAPGCQFSREKVEIGAVRSTNRQQVPEGTRYITDKDIHHRG